MILLTEEVYATIGLGWRYDDGQWLEPEPEPVVPEPYQPTITDAIQLMNDIKVDLLIAEVIKDV